MYYRYRRYSDDRQFYRVRAAMLNGDYQLASYIMRNNIRRYYGAALNINDLGYFQPEPNQLRIPFVYRADN